MDPSARPQPWHCAPRRSTCCCSLVGCFLDPLSAILLLTPLLVPLVKALGIDTVHFGIVVTVNLAIGLFHPPFGINIFVAQSVLGLKLETIYRGIVPFIVHLSRGAPRHHLRAADLALEHAALSRGGVTGASPERAPRGTRQCLQ